MTTNPLPIAVALDKIPLNKALEIASALKGKVWGFKVNDLLVNEGVCVVTKLKEFGSVFADPKFYDIPNTVKNSVKRLADSGADIITIHASGGSSMIEAAVESTSDTKIICVTALTSLDDQQTQIVYKQSCKDLVENLVKLTLDTGAHGIVCSALELEMINNIDKDHRLLRVTPGIRPETNLGENTEKNNNSSDDQKRISTPSRALENGSDLLVIGRPITEQADLLSAVMKIAATIS